MQLTSSIAKDTIYYKENWMRRVDNGEIRASNRMLVLLSVATVDPVPNAVGKICLGNPTQCICQHRTGSALTLVVYIYYHSTLTDK